MKIALYLEKGKYNLNGPTFNDWYLLNYNKNTKLFEELLLQYVWISNIVKVFPGYVGPVFVKGP